MNKHEKTKKRRPKATTKESKLRRFNERLMLIFGSMCIISAIGMLGLVIYEFGFMPTTTEASPNDLMTVHDVTAELPVIDMKEVYQELYADVTPAPTIEDLNEDELPWWSGQGEFKSWECYREITDTTSKQWELQQISWTNDDGVRYREDYPLIAIGSGHGIGVGEKCLVYMANGYVFTAMVGDFKKDIDTEENNIIMNADGSIIEFIVDDQVIAGDVRKFGDFSYDERYAGPILDIKKVE